MAQGATTKSKSASRGRASRAIHRNRTKTDRTSRDTRSRSRAADARKRRREAGSPELARHPRNRRGPARNTPKNRRQRNVAAD
jgi:hypothetical protein